MDGLAHRAEAERLLVEAEKRAANVEASLGADRMDPDFAAVMMSGAHVKALLAQAHATLAQGVGR